MRRTLSSQLREAEQRAQHLTEVASRQAVALREIADGAVSWSEGETADGARVRVGSSAGLGDYVIAEYRAPWIRDGKGADVEVVSRLQIEMWARAALPYDEAGAKVVRLLATLSASPAEEV